MKIELDRNHLLKRHAEEARELVKITKKFAPRWKGELVVDEELDRESYGLQSLNACTDLLKELSKGGMLSSRSNRDDE